MNTEPQNNGPDTPPSAFAPATAPPGANAVPLSGPAGPAPQSSIKSRISRSPRGKIARLPKATRDKLNFMLRDGLKQKDVLAGLGDEVKGISIRNVSNWHLSPAYDRWLLEQDWLENIRADQESAFDLLDDFDAPKFNEAALQLAVTRLFMAFRQLDTGDLNQKLGGNSQAFARLVNSLARASHATTNIEKYRNACAKAVAAELKQLNEDRELSDREFELLTKRMDRVFKVRRPTPPAAPAPSAGPAASVPPSHSSHSGATAPSAPTGPPPATNGSQS